MVASSAAQATGTALRYSHNTPGMCLAYVRTWLDIGSMYPSAISGWSNSGTKHSNDRHPPAGAPVFWRGGSRGFGHIALSMGGGKIRSTDCPGERQVSTVDLGWVEQHWGQTYLGWTESLNGVLIPYLSGTQVSQWAAGDVWTAMLHQGNRNSDSVARLVYRLRHNLKIPDRYKPDIQRNDYNADVVQAVRYWQRNVRPKIPGPDDGTKMSNQQTGLLFGKHYTVHPK